MKIELRDVSEEENKGTNSDTSSEFVVNRKLATPMESVMGDIDEKNEASTNRNKNRPEPINLDELREIDTTKKSKKDVVQSANAPKPRAASNKKLLA